MKEERRQFIRQLTSADVRVYHPVLGSVRGRVEEWSEGAVRLFVDIPSHNGHDYAQEHFQLEADFMDVIFTMQFVRLDEQGMVLSFVDDGDILAGDRL